MSELTVEKQNNISADDEIRIQSELEKCKKSFQNKNIISKELLLGTYVKPDSIKYNDSEYSINANSSVDHNILRRGTKVYIPVFVINFQKLQLVFSPGWFRNKDNARNALKKYDSFDCILNDGELYVLDESNNRLTNFISKRFYFWKDIIQTIDIFLLWSIQCLIYLGTYIIIYQTIFGHNFDDELSPIFVSMVLSSISTILFYNLKHNQNYDIMQEIKNLSIDKNNSNKYKIITAKVNINPTEVEIYSDELNCKWVFEKDSDYKLPDECIQLLNNSDGENNIVISVNKDFTNKSIIQSEDKKWWIESIEN